MMPTSQLIYQTVPLVFAPTLSRRHLPSSRVHPYPLSRSAFADWWLAQRRCGPELSDLTHGQLKPLFSGFEKQMHVVQEIIDECVPAHLADVQRFLNEHGVNEN